MNIYESLAPIMTQDYMYDYPGAALSGAYASMFDDVSTLVRDQDDGTPGWAILFQPDRLAQIDPAWLDWVAQFTGDSAAVRATSDVASKIFLLQNPVQFNVGKPDTIKQTIQGYLTGTKTVILNADYGSQPFQLEIVTYADETPVNPVPMRQNLVNNVIPAWLAVTWTTVEPGTYAQLDASHATYAEMEAAHTSYEDILTNPGA